MALAELRVGSLVRVRDRDWVVLPHERPDVLHLRPVAGYEHETCAVFLPLEGRDIVPSGFPEPDAARAGDFESGRLLRNAARLSLRAGAGPFRSLARLSVRPRPYQYVPLVMALRLDPVRLFIADDVGVGKTIEAALVAAELLERGIIRRMCVLCPPWLCEQWERQLNDKFHLNAKILRTGTVARLERELPHRGMSLYEYHRCLVISIDYIKGEAHRDEFIARCPELVIVDEAHQCARPRGERGEQQRRYELLSRIARDPRRHLVLLTATPHSGVEESFRSLLGLLDPAFEEVDPYDPVAGDHARLARHFVQRRRADVEGWLGTPTPFPRRVQLEAPYSLGKEWVSLFEDVLAFTRERVREPGMPGYRQRVRYWAAVSLLRCLMSSPASAVEALARKEKALGLGEADEDLRRREIMDPLVEEGVLDFVPDAVLEEATSDLPESGRRKLRGFLRRALALRESGDDPKLSKCCEVVGGLLREGFSPIVYCRFVATARYVAEGLKSALGAAHPGLDVRAVTGEMDDEQREAAVKELVGSFPRVLVATDCLSEGIDLQEHFDAVVHYDLPWNPNRLEQREGRVDRYGQRRPEVRAVLLYGTNNPIDGAVLDVLLRKARVIKERLGISVPVPADSETVMEAVVNALLLQDRPLHQLQFDFVGISSFHAEWDRAAERERSSRNLFRQYGIDPAEVSREIEAVDEVLGDPGAVRSFVLSVCRRLGLPASGGDVVEVDFSSAPEWLLDDPRWRRRMRLAFTTPAPDGAVAVERNHPLVSALAAAVLREAFSGDGDRRFSRCGAHYTQAVPVRTVVVLLRIRYCLEQPGRPDAFAEEVAVAGFRRTPEGDFKWYYPGDPEILSLLEGAEPSGNMPDGERRRQVEWALGVLKEDRSREVLQDVALSRGVLLEESHSRVSRQLGEREVRVHPYEPDVLGVYVLVPGGGPR
ncbi:MAG: helicase-related protein [Bacillota bacterium]